MSHWYLNRNTRERMSWGDSWLDRRLTIFQKWFKKHKFTSTKSYMYNKTKKEKEREK